MSTGEAKSPVGKRKRSDSGEEKVKMTETSTVTLNNGVKLPLLGLGTSRSKTEECIAMVQMALECGYRHIDTATLYGNEEAVGEALSTTKIPRAELFITTKLWQEDHGYEKALAGFEKSLKALKLDYIDLYLIHWPCASAEDSAEANEKLRAESWRALEKIYSEGKAKAIGVSNFTVGHLEKLKKTSKVTPTVNQVEYHPRCAQTELLKYCKANGIVLESYSTLGKGQLLSHDGIKAIANKYKLSTSQILLRWSLQTGVPVIPKSAKKERLLENISIFSFEIAADDMKTLDALNDGWRCVRDPNLVL